MTDREIRRIIEQADWDAQYHRQQFILSRIPFGEYRGYERRETWRTLGLVALLWGSAMAAIGVWVWMVGRG